MPKQESTSQVPSRRICKQDFDKAPLQNAIPNQGLNAMSLCGTNDSLVTPSASCVYAEESTLVGLGWRIVGKPNRKIID